MGFFSELREAIHILRSRDYQVVSPEELQLRREASARNVCKKLSRGNIFLMNGQFITTRQFEQEQKRGFVGS